MGTQYHSLRALDERLAGRIPFLAEENDAIASDRLRFGDAVMRGTQG